MYCPRCGSENIIKHLRLPASIRVSSAPPYHIPAYMDEPTLNRIDEQGLAKYEVEKPYEREDCGKRFDYADFVNALHEEERGDIKGRIAAKVSQETSDNQIMINHLGLRTSIPLRLLPHPLPHSRLHLWAS